MMIEGPLPDASERIKPLVLADWLCAAIMTFAAKGFRYLAHNRSRMRRFQAACDKAGVAMRTTHYYEPHYRAGDLPDDICSERFLPGIDFAEPLQLELLSRCQFADELKAIPVERPAIDHFGYDNGTFGPGDAEMLYNLVRILKPRRFVEVGSGNSTLMTRIAIAANQRDDPGYMCDHICIEPHEHAWLETLDITVVRGRVEHIGQELSAKLAADDIFFIDSSHVIRPYGDVLAAFQQMIPTLAEGVYVHVHDVHTPREYPEAWVRRDRRLWNEQYLLESFLAFNSEFEIVNMVNWLHHHHRDALASACPVLGMMPQEEPGSFWFRRKLSAAAMPYPGNMNA